jgi:hypothetical protein
VPNAVKGRKGFQVVALEERAASPAMKALERALQFGLEYFGHELDDVTGRAHAITPEAKRFEEAMEALATVAAELERRERLEAALAHPLGCEACMEGVRYAVEMDWRYLDRSRLCAEGQKAWAALISSGQPADLSHLDSYYLGGNVTPMSRAEKDERQVWEADYRRRIRQPAAQEGES